MVFESRISTNEQRIILFMKIIVDDLSGPEVHALLQEHLDSMQLYSPPESIHALNLEELRKPEIAFWTAWENDVLLGCGALKALDSQHGEIKSMRTSAQHRRQGVARELLRHIIEVATQRGYKRLSLETGSHEAFMPARTLYVSFGFTYCEPFGDYQLDPFSVFMTLEI
jgi:putative acetyltransferase